jgi:hypothetical protein
LNVELRGSGRDLAQIKDDGTHAILAATGRTNVQPDHARVPVMWLRHSDGKMRRDGSRAALLQRPCPVAERGRPHGAPGLAAIMEPRVVARIRGPCRERERNREWVRERRRHDRLLRQDKARKVRRGRSCDGADAYCNFTCMAAPCGNLSSPLRSTCQRNVVGPGEALPDQPTPVKARARARPASPADGLDRHRQAQR